MSSTAVRIQHMVSTLVSRSELFHLTGSVPYRNMCRFNSGVSPLRLRYLTPGVLISMHAHSSSTVTSFLSRSNTTGGEC